MKNLIGILLASTLCFSLANAANEEACANGDAKECFLSAKSYDDSGNSAKALEFYSKACELGYAVGCNKSGEKYIFAQDTENAKTFYSKACDLNHHESCVNLGEIFENEGNCEKAREIYEDTFKNKTILIQFILFPFPEG